jgi:hypothetical protein
MSYLIVESDFIMGLDNRMGGRYNRLYMKLKEYLLSTNNSKSKHEKFVSQYEFKNFGQREFGILMKKNLKIPVSSISL